MKKSVLYVLLGFCFGLIFPVTAVALEIMTSELSFNLETLVLLHDDNLFLYVVELAPFVLGSMGYFVARREFSAEQKSDALHNAKFTYYYQSTQDILVEAEVVEDELRITSVNERFLKATGFKIQEVDSQPLFSFFTARDVGDLISTLLAGPFKDIPAELTTKNIGKFTCLASGVPELDSQGLLVKISLFLRPKSTEDLWQDRSNIADELNQFFAKTNSPIVVLNKSGTITGWNPAAERLTGQSIEKVIGHSPLESIVTEESFNTAKRVFEDALQGIETQNFHLSLKGDEKTECIELIGNATAKRDASGNVSGVILVTHDVSELNAAHKAVERTAKEMRNLIDYANAPVIGIDLNGNINEWNNAAEKITGYKKEQVLDRHLEKHLLSEESKLSAHREFEAALAGQRRESLEIHLQTKDDSFVELLLSATTRRDLEDKITGVIFIGQDLTETREKARLARHAQNLDSIGKLTGGIAHDFNNLLSVIKGNVRILAENLDSNDPELRELIQDTLSAAEDGTNLNKQLLMLAKKQPAEAKQVDVNELVRRSTRLLQRTLGRGITFQLDCCEDKLETKTEPGSLESALVNLCINARDAMNGSGHIKVSTGHIESESKEGLPQSYVFISVADSGCGIKSEHLNLITQPFFTTKSDSHGTGLGLSMIQSFLEQAGGWMDISSEQNIGTEIIVYLPRLDLEPCKGQSDTPMVESRGDTTILVVDDDVRVQKYAKRCLEKAGYTVVVADSAENAMSEVKTHREISIVFSDIVMPGGQSGRDLASWLRSEYPDIKVQLTTGYTELASSNSNGMEAPVLAKPYTQTELIEALHSLQTTK